MIFKFGVDGNALTWYINIVRAKNTTMLYKSLNILDCKDFLFLLHFGQEINSWPPHMSVYTPEFKSLLYPRLASASLTWMVQRYKILLKIRSIIAATPSGSNSWKAGAHLQQCCISQGIYDACLIHPFPSRGWLQNTQESPLKFLRAHKCRGLYLERQNS